MIEIIMIVLILLMILGAVVAVETPNLLHSVISVGAVGFLLSIVFLFLSAPDLAITQIAVEVITLVLLLRATLPYEPDDQVSPGRVSIGKMAAIVMVVAVGVFSAQMFAEFPEFGNAVVDRFADAPSNTYLRDGLKDTGAANIVTAVLLDFRAYDTLGEATVLFCAVMGALSVLRPKAKSRSPKKADAESDR